MPSKSEEVVAVEEASPGGDEGTAEEAPKNTVVGDIQYHVDYLSSRYSGASIHATVPGEEASFEPQGEQDVKDVLHAIEVRKKIYVRDIRRY